MGFKFGRATGSSTLGFEVECGPGKFELPGPQSMEKFKWGPTRPASLGCSTVTAASWQNPELPRMCSNRFLLPEFRAAQSRGETKWRGGVQRCKLFAPTRLFERTCSSTSTRPPATEPASASKAAAHRALAFPRRRNGLATARAGRHAHHLSPPNRLPSHHRPTHASRARHCQDGGAGLLSPPHRRLAPARSATPSG